MQLYAILTYIGIQLNNEEAHMKVKRLICFFIAIFMLAATLASCDKENEAAVSEESSSQLLAEGTQPFDDTFPEQITNQNSGEQVTEQITEISKLDLAMNELGSVNKGFFDGDSFHILAIDGTQDQFNIAELTSEPLADSVYQRNVHFKEVFGVDVETTTVDIQMFVEHFTADAKSSHIYDMACGYTTFHIDLAVNGLLYNFLNLEPYVDFDNPWWDQGTRSFIIGDSIWFMNGSMNYEDDTKTYCMMFNKELAKKHYNTADVFYDSVKNMEWTMETMYSYAQNVSENLGDPVWDENDRYGFVCTWEYGIGFFYASDLKFVRCEAGKEPAIILNSAGISKATDLLEDIQLLFNKEITYWPICGEEQKGLKAFFSDRALFFGEITGYILDANKNMESDFGILPLPMYDKAQGKYISWAHGINSSFIIPHHLDDPERFGLMLEGFNILSDYHVRPAFYDIVLTRKSVKDADSGPMLDIIFKGRVYDFAMCYTNLGLMHAFNNCVTGNHTGFATEYAKVKQLAAGKLRTLNRRFQMLQKT